MKFSAKKGFTLIEVIIVMTLIAVLVSFVFVDILGSQRKASLSSSVTLLISDLKLQQIKSMGGENGGVSVASPSGILFGPGTYTLFSGAGYKSTDPSNLAVSVESSMQMSTTLVGNTLLFASGSGEVANFSTGADSITLRNLTSNETRVIKLNKFGVVTQVN